MSNTHKNSKPSLDQLKKMSNLSQNTVIEPNQNKTQPVTHKTQSQSDIIRSGHQAAAQTHKQRTTEQPKVSHTKKSSWYQNKMLWIVVGILLFSLGLNMLTISETQKLSAKNQESTQLLNNLSKRLGLTETEVKDLNSPVASPAEIVQSALKSVVLIEKQIDSIQMSQLRDNVKDQYVSGSDKDIFNQAAPAKDLWESLGSGVILASSGEIITNKHIVATGGNYRAKTYDGKIFTLSRAMLHPYEDLAIVIAQKNTDSTQANGNDLGLTPINFQTEPVKPGDEIYALGHPLKLSFSVSKGVVSNPNRNFGAELDNYLENIRLPEVLRRAYFDKSGQESLLPLFLNSDLAEANLLQHSAAISLGSSGGAIIDTQGKLLGINTFGVQRQDSDTYNLVPNLENVYQAPENLQEVTNKITQGYTPGSDFNINGAIKADVVQRIWKEYQQSVENKTKFGVPYLGFYVANYGQSQAALLGLPISHGVQIVQPADKIYKYDLPAIDPNGPAKDSGLKDNDIVAAIDDTELSQANDIGKILSSKKSGDAIKITYYRQNGDKNWDKNETNFTLGFLPAFDEENLKNLKLGDISL